MLIHFQVDNLFGSSKKPFIMNAYYRETKGTPPKTTTCCYRNIVALKWKDTKIILRDKTVQDLMKRLLTIIGFEDLPHRLRHTPTSTSC